MTPVGFEPTISAGKRPQTYASDRATTGTGTLPYLMYIKDKQILVFSFVFDLSWKGGGSSVGSVADMGCRELPNSEQHGSRQLPVPVMFRQRNP